MYLAGSIIEPREKRELLFQVPRTGYHSPTWEGRRLITNLYKSGNKGIEENGHGTKRGCRINLPISAFFRAGESFTPSPVTATIWPWRWQPSTMISFCWGEVLANTISLWFLRMSSIWAGVMSLRSVPWTTQAWASLESEEIYWISTLGLLQVWCKLWYNTKLQRINCICVIICKVVFLQSEHNFFFFTFVQEMCMHLLPPKNMG